MKYRIAIQQVTLGKFKHVHNIMLDSEDEKGLIAKIRKVINKEIKQLEKFKNERS